MNSAYESDKAKECLVEWIDTRLNAEYSKPNISKLLHDEIDMVGMRCGAPDAWRLVSDHGEPEEVVFKIQGVLVSCELPPFTKHPSRKVVAGVLRQGISLTGLGTEAFQAEMNGIKIADHILKRSVPDQDTEPLSCITEIDGVDILHISNRYFASRRFIEGEPAVEFGPEVDPHGILKKLGGLDFVHTKDNVVVYDRVKRITDDDIKFESVTPAIFRPGDIVEAQFTMMVLPIGKGGRPPYKSFVTLRVITLLDDSFTKQAAIKNIVTVKPKTMIKRRTGNDQEAEDTTTRALQKMKIGKD